jgi:hypothetical protein
MADENKSIIAIPIITCGIDRRSLEDKLGRVVTAKQMEISIREENEYDLNKGTKAELIEKRVIYDILKGPEIQTQVIAYGENNFDVVNAMGDPDNRLQWEITNYVVDELKKLCETEK